MERTLDEAKRASASFAPDPVHDLRVALRRCRSMAEVVQTFDPDPAWRKMRKAGKEVFSSLGELRDCQVLIELAQRLSADDDPVRAKLLEHLRTEESRLKASASQALQKFDTAQWKKWSGYLSKRITHYRRDSALYKGLALDRWEHARDLHLAAMRTRSKVSMHRLRIAVKKFRYVVENFLPTTHEVVGNSLKQVQDLLGEIHDLDILRETATRIGAFSDAEQRRVWSDILQRERRQRVDAYRKLVSAKPGIWQVWRGQLPDGVAAQTATQKRLEIWASLLDPDPEHSRRVARLSMELHHSLVKESAYKGDGRDWRPVLNATAITHDVGLHKKKGGHHKRTEKLLRNIELPFAWSEEDLVIAALAARFHSGALPSARQGTFKALSAEGREKVIQLAAVVRLANAIDRATNGKASQARIERTGEYLTLSVDGLLGRTREAERVAGAAYLLELVCRRPIKLVARSRQVHN